MRKILNKNERDRSVYFNMETGQIEVSTGKGFFKDKNREDYRLLPIRLGIIWSADQSNNQMVFDSTRFDRVDYVFRTEDDIPLVNEYLDQIEEYYRGREE